MPATDFYISLPSKKYVIRKQTFVNRWEFLFLPGFSFLLARDIFFTFKIELYFDSYKSSTDNETKSVITIYN